MVLLCLVKLGCPFWGVHRKRDRSATLLRHPSNPPQTVSPSKSPATAATKVCLSKKSDHFGDAFLIFTDSCQAEGLPRFALTPSLLRSLGISISCVDLSRAGPCGSTFPTHLLLHNCVGPVPNLLTLFSFTSSLHHLTIPEPALVVSHSVFAFYLFISLQRRRITFFPLLYPTIT